MPKIYFGNVISAFLDDGLIDTIIGAGDLAVRDDLHTLHDIIGNSEQNIYDNTLRIQDNDFDISLLQSDLEALSLGSSSGQQLVNTSNLAILFSRMYALENAHNTLLARFNELTTGTSTTPDNPSLGPVVVGDQTPPTTVTT